MRSRTLTRLALSISLAVGLSGAAGVTATASPEPSGDELIAPFAGSDAGTAPEPSTSLAPEASITASSIDDAAGWSAFRDLNYWRLYEGVEPVIRHGALDALAGDWASMLAASEQFYLDDNLGSKVPAGSGGGYQWLHRSAYDDTDMSSFLDDVFLALPWEFVEADLSDSGIAIARSGHYLYAYFIIGVYPHSTPAAGELPLYRFYKPGAGTHFYSTSAAERNDVIRYNSDYRYEGLVAYINGPGATSELNRFYLASAGTHFYTSSPAEYASVLTYPQYSLDGVAGRVHAAPGAGLSAMHRFFRPASGTHFYSASQLEVQQVKTIPGYVYEGVAFYLRVAG